MAKWIDYRKDETRLQKLTQARLELVNGGQ